MLLPEPTNGSHTRKLEALPPWSSRASARNSGLTSLKATSGVSHSSARLSLFDRFCFAMLSDLADSNIQLTMHVTQ
jgi:hypothetical protein